MPEGGLETGISYWSELSFEHILIGSGMIFRE